MIEVGPLFVCLVLEAYLHFADQFAFSEHKVDKKVSIASAKPISDLDDLNFLVALQVVEYPPNLLDSSSAFRAKEIRYAESDDLLVLLQEAASPSRSYFVVHHQMHLVQERYQPIQVQHCDVIRQCGEQVDCHATLHDAVRQIFKLRLALLDVVGESLIGRVKYAAIRAVLVELLIAVGVDGCHQFLVVLSASMGFQNVHVEEPFLLAFEDILLRLDHDSV